MTNITYLTNEKTIFPTVKHSLNIQELLQQKNIDFDNTSMELIAIDSQAKKAIFINHLTKEQVVKDFDLLFVNPDYDLPSFLGNLAHEGELNIDHSTLIHKKFNNIFAAGHVTRSKNYIQTPKGIIQQSCILSANIDAIIKAEVHKQTPNYVKYTGNTVVPLFVGNKEIVNIEVDPTRLETWPGPSKLAFLREVYAEPNIYFKLTTQGVWFGETGFKKPSFNTTPSS